MREKSMKVVMCQLNTWVGDITGNTAKVLASVAVESEPDASHLFVFPELTLTGYPPEDLLLRPALAEHIDKAIDHLKRELPPQAWVLIGYPRTQDGELFNAAGMIHKGQLVAEYHKQCLPNYQVFDEKRYFSEGNAPCVIDVDGVKVGVTICEDIWHSEPADSARRVGAEILVNLNASPFHRGKHKERWELLGDRAREQNIPMVYVNQVGGQDELVFDGGSFAVNADGQLAVVTSDYTEGQYQLAIERSVRGIVIEQQPIPKGPAELASVWQALVTGVRDYVEKNGFPGVVLGLSGGIDSAVTLAVAVDALGAERVQAVMMPFRYTADMSIEDAAEQANVMGVEYSAISIEAIFDEFMQSLAPQFEGLSPDITEENLQARCRGVLLMSISNKRHRLVLTTGNKSELAVGYSTLYGDMAGGFDALKDCPKMLVYALARYRNSLGYCIPERVIERPPSAELAPDQKDEDSLPPYDVLDDIIERYVELDESPEVIIGAGFERADVERVTRLIDLNEYKRRQAPVGVRITTRGFGRDRRYPISWAWRKN
jgi:NAD+ synthase (glutamine-hydrolysing)|tara:strand:+ start:302 stop:1936 length:1635 start_codon:yes stop_codon:yes gene_type:complete